jgi:hypothetical protein
MRKVFRIVIGIVFALALVAGGVFFWATRTIEEIEARWKADIAAEHARAAAVRRAPLRGEARDANAAEEYWALAKSFGPALADPQQPKSDLKVVHELATAVFAAPAPLSADAAAFMAAHADAIAALREATRAARCDWKLAYEDGIAMPIPNLVVLRVLAEMLILDGHARELAGDPRGAAERYLDCVRFGADLGEGGDVLLFMGSVSFSATGDRQLARLAGSGALADADLAEVERELGLLEAAIPALAGAVRAERLIHVADLLELPRTGKRKGVAASVAPEPTAWRTIVGAWDLRNTDRALRGAEAALAIPGAKARREQLSAIEAAPPIWRAQWVWCPNLPVMDDTACEAAALRRITAAAVAAARFRAKRGEFPAALGDCMADVPEDPFDDAPLRYARAPDGGSAKIWSVGDAGAPSERTALELKAPP